MSRLILLTTVLGTSFLISSCGGGDGHCSLVFTAAGVCNNSKKIMNEYLQRSTALYSTAPNITSCQAGILKDTEKQNVLTALNDIRKIHGLGAVQYDTSSDEQVMQASLMMAANGTLSHYPPSSWKCYSAAGAEGAATSNLSGGIVSPNLGFTATEGDIFAWLTDVDNNIANNIGHRRWLLDPFLKSVSYGRVGGRYDDNNVSEGSAIKVIYANNSTNGVANTEIVAYPIGDYPVKYYAGGALLSFSVVVSVIDKQLNSTVDFSSASISISRRGGNPMPVRNISYDNNGYGLPNNLQFATDSLDINVVYDVNVNDVKVNGLTKNYSYWFRIVQ